MSRISAIYGLPPFIHIKSKNYVNAIVASKHPSCQWLTMEQAVKHCTQGIGIWEWASNDCGEEPDIVMACCGDTPTLEIMAAVTILRDEMPDLKIRVVNVVDLFKLESDHKHPHGLSDAEYDAIFTKDKPVIFAFHGYPTLIHELTYERHNHNIPLLLRMNNLQPRMFSRLWIVLVTAG